MANLTKIIQYVLLGTFCLGLLTFVVTYFKSNWKVNVVGRYIMYFMITLTALFIYLMLGEVLGDYSGRALVNVAFLLAINYGAWKIVWLLYKIRKNGEVKDDENIRRR